MTYNRPWCGVVQPNEATAMVQGSVAVFPVPDCRHITAQALFVGPAAAANASIAIYGSIDGGVTYFPTALATLTSDDPTNANSYAHNVESCWTHIVAIVNTLTGGNVTQVRIFGRAL